MLGLMRLYNICPTEIMLLWFPSGLNLNQKPGTIYKIIFLNYFPGFQYFLEPVTRGIDSTSLQYFVWYEVLHVIFP